MQDQFPQYALQDIVRKLQIDELRENIDVGLIGDNQVVITCTSDQPKLAVDMATKLAEIYRERKLADEVVHRARKSGVYRSAIGVGAKGVRRR